MKKIKNSLSTKVFIAILCMILPINLIALIATETAIKKTIEQVCFAKQDIVNIRMRDLESRMDNSTRFLSHMITTDSDAIAMFQQKKEDETYQLEKMRFFSKFRSNEKVINGAEGYFFYMQKIEDWLQYGKKTENDDIRKLMPQIKKNGMCGWNLYKTEGKQYLVYSFLQGSVLYGSWFQVDHILKEIGNKIGYKHTKLEFQKEMIESDYKKYQIADGRGNLYLKIVLDYNDILNELEFFPWVFRFSVIIFIFNIPFLYWLIRNLILNPLEIVRKAHQKMQLGDSGYPIMEEGNSIEVKNIFQSFNKMADDLQKYKFDAYEKELARQDMEILNLQLQIRPHFLLNMFNLLYTLLLQEDSEKLQNIILYLSNYFRYIFRDGKEYSGSVVKT